MKKKNRKLHKKDVSENKTGCVMKNNKRKVLYNSHPSVRKKGKRIKKYSQFLFVETERHGAATAY